MKTFTGRIVDPLALKPEDIDILDIAHGLSNICRYGGHCAQFYSVAQHSVHVMSLCSDDHKMAGLLHDAEEAYLGDIPRPLKRRPEYAFIREAGERARAMVFTRFGLDIDLPEEVHSHDHSVLVSEGIQLMNEVYMKFGYPASVIIEPLPPEAAERMFLDAYRALLRRQALTILAQ